MVEQGIIFPHGGQLIEQFLSDEMLLEAQTLPQLKVTAGQLSLLHRIADGTLSPLTGPMTSQQYNEVLNNATLTHNGEALAWTIPTVLSVTEETAEQLSSAGHRRVAVVSPEGNLEGVLQIEEIYPWNKQLYLESVYGTSRSDHPGGDILFKKYASHTHLIGGRVWMRRQQHHPAFARYMLSPRQTRALFAEKGWEAVVAFQTRNPLHRAHEYALVYGLESLLRQGLNAGAVLNPLVGETKNDDVSAVIRMKTYQRLIEDRVLGEGDADEALWQQLGEQLPDRVLLIGLDVPMFYAGPKEAVMHAIYRQNMGFSHIIIGRKHADAPFHDGTPIWGDFDAQEIFERLNGRLDIQPVKVGFAAYYESIGRVDLMENHPDEKPVMISGKKIREMLQRGEPIDPRIMRPSTAEILREAYRRADAA